MTLIVISVLSIDAVRKVYLITCQCGRATSAARLSPSDRPTKFDLIDRSTARHSVFVLGDGLTLLFISIEIIHQATSHSGNSRDSGSGCARGEIVLALLLVAATDADALQISHRCGRI